MIEEKDLKQIILEAEARLSKNIAMLNDSEELRNKLNIAIEGLEDFSTNCNHVDGDPNFRIMSDTYGYCYTCNGKMTIGSTDYATEILRRIK